MIASSFFQRWIWPAGGSGGIPGDVLGTRVWAILAAIATTIFYPPVRRAIEAYIKRHITAGTAELHAKTAELHAKLDHIIEHHPDIPPFESKNPE